MMRAVYKFPLPWPPSDAYVTIGLPVDARVLCVQVQAGVPCLWVLLDPSQASVTRLLRIAGTGHPIHDVLTGQGYLGTFQMLDGALVLHLFEVAP